MASILTRLLLLVAALSVAGCERPAADSADAPASPPDTARDALPRSSTAAAPAGASDPQGPLPPPTHAALALDPEGIRLVDTRNGASRLLPFGSREAATISTLSSVLAAKPVEQGEVDDCNARYARWPTGLGAWFTAGNFSGWAVPAEATGLATMAGVKPGSTRAELEAAYTTIVFESSLGTEFTAGDLAGVLSSDAPDARVTHLWSGTTCIAR